MNMKYTHSFAWSMRWTSSLQAFFNGIELRLQLLDAKSVFQVSVFLLFVKFRWNCIKQFSLDYVHSQSNDVKEVCSQFSFWCYTDKSLGIGRVLINCISYYLANVQIGHRLQLQLLNIPRQESRKPSWAIILIALLWRSSALWRFPWDENPHTISSWSMHVSTSAK